MSSLRRRNPFSAIRPQTRPSPQVQAAAAAGAEHRKTVAQRVSAGSRSSKRIQPRQGRQKPRVQGPLRNPVAPPGLETSRDAGPTADAVGYRLSVLRT